MRGLTPEEYDVLRLAAMSPVMGVNRMCTPEEEQIVTVLVAHGRAGLEPSSIAYGARRVTITPNGLEAMRLHESLTALEANRS